MDSSQTLTQRFKGMDPRWLALSVTTIGSFMSILDSTIVNIALPSMLRDFNTDLKNGQLVLTIYLLALAVVPIPISGPIAERVGIEAALHHHPGLPFTLGSALCGFAWNSYQASSSFAPCKGSAAACSNRSAWRSSSP